jgi:tRNA pseudouridine38-40 synthase
VPRYKIKIEYDGTNYCGWQKQHHSVSICAEIEKAIFNFSGENVELYGSGRTDAGVHAYGQIAHFDLNKENISPEKIRLALNFYLKGKMIVIISCEEAAMNFHARFDAIQRSYIYKICHRPSPLTFNYNRMLHIYEKLDLDLMQQAANFLIGQHDFSSLRASDCQAKSPIKKITNIVIIKNGQMIEIHVSARSFLYHMVRNIVGTLRYVANGKMSLEEFKTNFIAKDRSKMGPTAPACGLYLNEIEYL